MKIVKNFAAVLIILLALPAVGQAKELNAWRDCGIGAMIFSDYPVAAIISNVIWDLGTTAVISAATSKNTCKGKDVVAALFVHESYANLEEETLKGDGQHVHAMLDILGCNKSAQSGIIAAVRTDFSREVQDVSYFDKPALEKSEAYYNLVEAKIAGSYAQQCQAI